MSEMYSANQSPQEQPDTLTIPIDTTAEKRIASLEANTRRLAEQVATLSKNLAQSQRTIRRLENQLSTQANTLASLRSRL